MPFFESDAKILDEYIEEAQSENRLVEQFRQVHRQLAEGVLRRRRHEGKQLRLRLASARHGRPFASRLLAGNGQGKHRRTFRDGPESRRRRAEFAARTQSAGETQVAGGAGHGGDRNGFVLAGFAGGRTRRTQSAKKSTRKCFCFPPRAMPKKTAASRTRSGCNQFHEKAVEPPGDARSETWFMYHLGRRLKEKAARDRTAAKRRTCGRSPGTIRWRARSASRKSKKS